MKRRRTKKNTGLANQLVWGIIAIIIIVALLMGILVFFDAMAS